MLTLIEDDKLYISYKTCKTSKFKDSRFKISRAQNLKCRPPGIQSEKTVQ